MNLKAFELLTAFDSKQLLSNKLALEISCIYMCGKNLYIGSNDSKLVHFFVDENTEVRDESRFICLEQGMENLHMKKPILQIQAMTSLKQVLVLCDSTLTTLNMLDLKARPNKLKNISIFCINQNPIQSDPFSVQLCVGNKRKSIQVYIQTEDSLTLLWEAAIDSIPLTLQMDREIVCAGLENEYMMLNFQKNTKQSLFPFNLLQIRKPLITHISQDEFLVSAPNALGVFTQSGGISHRPPLQWTNNIEGFVYMHPYIVVLNDEFITVHSIIDQQQKQTIPFEGGKLIGQFEGRIFIADRGKIYALLSLPIEQQIEHLIEEHRLNEAIELTKASLPSCQHFQMVSRRLHIQAGIHELKQANFQAANELLKEGGMDVVELLSFYSELLPQNTPTTPTSPTLSSSPSLASLLSKIQNLSHPNNQLFTDDLSKSLYYHFLYDYIMENYPFIVDGPDSKLVNTVLVKLTSQLHPSKLLPLIRQLRHYDVSNCCRYLKHKGRYHAAAVAYSCWNDSVGESHLAAMKIWKSLMEGEVRDEMYPGDGCVYDFLSRCKNASLLKQYMPFLLEYHQVKTIQIFMIKKPSEKEEEVLKDDEIIDFLTSSPSFRHAYMLFLEHLVFKKNSQKESHHTNLATVYLDLILHDESKEGEKSDETKEGHETGVKFQPLTVESLRPRLRHLLHTSSLYRVQWLISRIHNTDLLHELAILYGKIEEHDKAIDILANKLSDHSAAEEYVINNSKNSSQSYRTKLFQQLLDNYLQRYKSSNDDVMKKTVVDLLSKHELNFNLAKVLDSLPDDWNLSELWSFIGNCMRASASANRNKKIETMLLESVERSLRKEMADGSCHVVSVSEERKCQVCGKEFTDTTVVIHPAHQAVTHLKCQHSLSSLTPPTSLQSYSPSSGYISSFSSSSSSFPHRVL